MTTQQTWPKLMGFRTLADYLGLSQKALRRRYERGQLPEPFRFGDPPPAGDIDRRSVFFLKDDIDRMLEAE